MDVVVRAGHPGRPAAPAGRPREAADGYRQAIGLAANEQVRAFLRRRLAEVEDPAG